MASSGNYVSEPPTSGKVVIRTTAGEVHMELWAKEAPRSCRNFIQLCLEGYYVGCLFHRVVPGILVQTGDPTNTGTGGESVYGSGFPDEFHSRLRFSHRGLVAWANLRRNDNRSQFFITLDKTAWLDQRHTIFAKVTGNSVYTAVKLAEGEVGANDRPADPHQILATEVVANPFPDIAPRETKAPAPPAPLDLPLPKKKPSKSLLSFEDAESEVPSERIQSSHDVLSDAHLLKETDPSLLALEAKDRKAEETAALKRDLRTRVEEKQRRDEEEDDDEDDQDFDLVMKKRVLEQREQFSMADPHALLIETTEAGGYTIEADKNKVTVRKPVSVDEELESLQSSFLRIKQNKTGTNNPLVQQAIRDEEQMLTPLELRRFHYRQAQRKTKGREEHTLAKLNEFMSKVEEHQKPPELQTDQEKKLWFNNRLHFSVDSTTAYAFNRAEEDKKKKVAHESMELDPQRKMMQYNENEDRYKTAELKELLSLEHLEKITSKQQE